MLLAVQVAVFPAQAPVTMLDGTLAYSITCGGVDDTAAFEAAIASIGGRPGRIILPDSRRCAVGSLSIPDTITLDNANGRGIKVNDGEVLAILGDVANPLTRLLFDNATAGHGHVTFAGNTRVDAITPQWFGAAADGVTLDVDACRAAVDALPSPGHLHFPAGVYWLGAATTSARLSITSNDITITGDGIQRTILKYDSDVPNIDGTFGPGSLLLIGEITGPHWGYVLEDFTIEDIQTRTRWTGAHNPSGVDAYKVDRIRIERVEAINVKGNSAFNVFSPSRNGRDFTFRQNIVRGTPAGGYVQGVGLNFAAFSNLLIEQNTIEGVGLGGIGAGACGACSNIRILNNTIDYLDRSPGPAGLIFTGDGDGITVSGNIIRRFGGGQRGIMIGSEDGGANYPIRNVVVSNNVIEATARTVDRGIELGGNWQYVSIRNNRIRATYPIDIVSGKDFGSLQITGNTLDSFDATGPALAKAPVSIASRDAVLLQDNVVTGTGMPLKLVDFAAFPIWRSPSVTLQNNRIGERVEQSWNGQIDGVTRVATGQEDTLAAGRSTVDARSTMFGARPGDRVDITLSPGFPPGVSATGSVIAPDVIVWRVTNASSSDAVLPGPPNNFATIRVTPR